MWPYVTLAGGIVAAMAVPVVAGARVLARSLSTRDREGSRTELRRELLTQLERYG
jgi:hypothetical protein